MNRVSSTSIGAYVQCPRKFWYRYRDENPLEQAQNEAMAVGTVFHAFMEFRASKGRWPTDGEFAAMKGSYDDPIESVRKFPKSKEQGFHMAQYVLREHPEILDVFTTEGVELEKPLDDFGLVLDGDVVASGYIDVYIPATHTIRDYKTRGSMRFTLRTDEDFRADVQQSYYAAVVARATGWDHIHVEHVNVLRPPNEGVEVIGVDLPIPYLRMVWEDLDKKVVPAMKALASTKCEEDVPVNRGACWNYGQCQFYGICGQTREEKEEDPFAAFKNTTEEEDPFAFF